MSENENGALRPISSAKPVSLTGDAIYAGYPHCDMGPAANLAGHSLCNMRIPYLGYEVSVYAVAPSLGSSEPPRSDLLVFDSAGRDVTAALLPEFPGGVPATAESLKEAFSAIDDLAD